MPLQLQIASETPACSSDTPVGPSLNSGKFTLLSQPGKHIILIVSKYQGVHVSQLDKFGAKGKRSVQNEICAERCGGDARSEDKRSQGHGGEQQNRQHYSGLVPEKRRANQ